MIKTTSISSFSYICLISTGKGFLPILIQPDYQYSHDPYGGSDIIYGAGGRGVVDDESKNENVVVLKVQLFNLDFQPKIEKCFNVESTLTNAYEGDCYI